MSPTKSMIAVLFALGSAAALAQNGAQQQAQPPTGKPVSDSASYGPVLNPQSSPATPPPPTRPARSRPFMPRCGRWPPKRRPRARPTTSIGPLAVTWTAMSARR